MYQNIPVRVQQLILSLPWDFPNMYQNIPLGGKVPWKGEDKLLYSHWDILVHVWKVPWKGEYKLLYSHWDILVHVWKVLAISNVFT
jgi:hypothetical protein